jgi:hypothetical protein
MLLFPVLLLSLFPVWLPGALFFLVLSAPMLFLPVSLVVLLLIPSPMPPCFSWLLTTLLILSFALGNPLSMADLFLLVLAIILMACWPMTAACFSLLLLWLVFLLCLVRWWGCLFVVLLPLLLLVGHTISLSIALYSSNTYTDD